MNQNKPAAMNFSGANIVGATIEGQINNYYHPSAMQSRPLNHPASSVGEQSRANSNSMSFETVNNNNQQYINNSYHASNKPSSASGGEQLKANSQANSHPTSRETPTDENQLYTFPVIEGFERMKKINKDFVIAHWKLHTVIDPLNKIKERNQDNYEQLTKDLNNFTDDIKEHAKSLAKNEIARSFMCEEFTIDNHPIQNFDDVRKFLKSKQMRLAFEEDCIIPVAIVVKCVFSNWSTVLQEEWLDQEIVKYTEEKYRCTFQRLHRNDKKRTDGQSCKRMKHPLLLMANLASKRVYESILDILYTNYGLTIRRQDKKRKGDTLISLKNVFPQSINVGGGALFLLINPKWHVDAVKEEWDGHEVKSLDELPIQTSQVSFFASMMALEAIKKNVPLAEGFSILQKYFNLCDKFVDPQAFKDRNTALSKEAEKLSNKFGSRVKNRPCSLGANNFYSHQQHNGFLPIQNQQPYHPPTPAGSHPPTNTGGYSHIHSQAQPYHQVHHSMNHPHQPQPWLTQQSHPADDFAVAAVDDGLAVDDDLLTIVEENLLQEQQLQPTPTGPAAQPQQDPPSAQPQQDPPSVTNDYLLEMIQQKSRSTIQEQQSQPLPTQGHQPTPTQGHQPAPIQVQQQAIPTATPATSRTATLPQVQQRQPAPIQVQQQEEQGMKNGNVKGSHLANVAKQQATLVNKKVRI